MAYPTRTSSRPAPQRGSQEERLGAILGDRGLRDPNLRAVKREDAADAGVIPLQSTLVTAAPTMEQHNALVADMRALAAVLNRLGANITWK